MNRPLRFAMVGLVLINLGFVQITEAAEPSWLAALFALTVAAPWLVRFTRYFWYRAIWNVGVQVVFGIMVHRFTGVGVQHLLNDGLILAVLCQVQLLNSLTAKQKPDLLFFNSFLIAVVTSYLSVDLPYMILFILYVPVFVFGLQLLSFTRTGAEPIAPLVRRMARVSVARSAAVLSLTLLVFLFYPRDFARKGFAGEALRFTPPRGLVDTDFTEEVALDRSGSVTRSTAVVFTAELTSGTAHAVDGYWRGATLTQYHGGKWHPGVSPREAPASSWSGRNGRFAKGEGRGVSSVRVKLTHTRAKRLFAPLQARRMRLVPPFDKLLVRHGFDATSSFEWTERKRGRPVEYAMELASPFRTPGGRPRYRREGAWTLVRRDAMPQRMRLAARDLRRRVGRDAEQFRIVEAMRSYLANGFTYLAPGESGAATSLEEFFFERKGGHCEIFATALVLMLRAEGIPCRLVTGYRSAEWDPAQRVMTVRKRDAHAWVEVLDPKAGWMTVDPTPTIDAVTAEGAGLWSEFRTWLTSVWSSVTGFDDGTRLAVLTWFRDLPGRSIPYLPAVVLVAVAWRWARRRRRRIPVAVADYARVLSSLRLELHPGETPRELLGRVELEAEPRARLEEATRRHEAQRYANV